MADEWEVFEHPRHLRSKTQDVPSLTITRRGALLLSRSAMHLIGTPDFVELAYDRARCIIRIAPLTENDASRIPVRTLSTRYSIAGLTFTKVYDIDRSQACLYEVMSRDGKLYSDLKQSGKQVTRERKR